MKKLRVLMVTLCVAVFLCGFSVTAYAGGGPEWEGLDPYVCFFFAWPLYSVL